ncbi:MAG: methionine--tRNA ligase [Proteobacteria bacterium]|nr:methionine--tRNA ligase [Pseudomonadota bacterium]
MKSEKTGYYTTTPIYYVNDKPHIGHAYTTLLADVLARYHRLLQVPTFFLTGTDEHGQKVQDAAVKNSITPQAQCDQTVVRFQELWEKLGITHDDFIRTTEERHVKVVQQILQDLYDRGEIYKGDYEGWYCVPCERFFTEKDLEDQKCPECRRPVEQITESAYHFRMSNYQDWLVQHINENSDFIQPEFRKNETLGFLRQPLGDLCISRPKTRLSWGIELPFDKDYVCYVWFDALVNYISAIGYLSDDELFNRWWPCSCHFIGKDILTTHTVYWPTMLKAMGVEMPKSIFAHGWWLSGDTKMSKSIGNVVNPMEMCDKYGIDAFRYFLMSEMTMGHDHNFSEEGFVEKYNSDLAGNLGNMLSRVIKMILPHFEGKLPPAGEMLPEDRELKQLALESVASMKTAIDKMALNQGLKDVMAVVKACNRYYQHTQPWVLAKENKRERLGTVINTAAETLRIVSGLLYPVIPDKMKEMRISLGISEDNMMPDIKQLSRWGQLSVGASVSDIKALFPRIETKKPPKVKKEKSQAAENVVDLIDIDQFFKTTLKTAKIIEAESVPDSKNLLKLQLEIGEEKRQIVGGIAKWYKPEELVGKNIVVVANLKPATIFGLESNGMLLAAKKGKKKMTLITTDDPDFASGASIG